MKNILFPTDFSKNSWNAIEYAITLLKDTPCNFYVLHVDALNRSGVDYNSFALPSDIIQPKAINMTPKDNPANIFARIKTITTNKEHHFIVLHEFGNIIDIIRKTVLEKKISLIVMGTKGASGIKETILGSNTGNVMTKVPCNLLVVPEKALQCVPKEIAFPTDYHVFYSHSILDAISKMLRITNAKLRVVHISKPNIKLNEAQKQNMAYLQDYLLELHEKSHSIHNLKLEKTKTAIEEFVINEKIDMVIMVAKNLNFLQQLLFGSTIKKISFQTSVPILVLHE